METQPSPALETVSLEAKSPFEMRVHLGDGVPAQGDHRQGRQTACGQQLVHRGPFPPGRRRTAMTVPDRRPACTASVTAATAASAAITTTSHVHQATAHLR